MEAVPSTSSKLRKSGNAAESTRRLWPWRPRLRHPVHCPHSILHMLTCSSVHRLIVHRLFLNVVYISPPIPTRLLGRAVLILYRPQLHTTACEMGCSTRCNLRHSYHAICFLPHYLNDNLYRMASWFIFAIYRILDSTRLWLILPYFPTILKKPMDTNTCIESQVYHPNSGSSRPKPYHTTTTTLPQS